jgi:dUTPase
MAKVDNLSDTDFVVKRGDRLFQICMPDLTMPFVVLDHVSVDTQRGTGGFGSTGR